jgi:hypothetical protein
VTSVPYLDRLDRVRKAMAEQGIVSRSNGIA